MANTYIFTQPDNAIAQRSGDGAFVPWDAQANQPKDITGAAGKIWQRDGSPIPDPYVAPPPTADEIRAGQFNADVDRQDIVTQVKNATPTQIKNYINNNVTDLASARVMLIKIALLVAKTIRD
jgi:hypothetical protein